ncbi:hypothetical protein Oscil6304_3737 [Oscillatoria acuminata PCC 6304]|uniref:Uncharacterized protein n=1 Tax=Oscillatoria acuminata PCC 6304 TaxID=56110 RepID=K9TKC8_9CYAN|nr:hypothetical protein Oscil6304_3737 [Oscillatoria acuminata PCC 6304]
MINLSSLKAEAFQVGFALASMALYNLSKLQKMTVNELSPVWDP